MAPGCSPHPALHERLSRAVAALTALAVLGASAVVGAVPAAAAPPAVTSVVVAPTGAGQPVPVVVEAADATDVSAEVVVGFGPPQTIALTDDGTGADATAGDGRWTGTVAAQPAGTLVRARAAATGPGGQGVYPPADDEARYRGAVVARPPVATGLPVVDWYMAPADHHALMTEIGSKTYRPAVLVVDGVVYDGVRIRLQGGAITQAVPKKNYRVKMAKGHDLVAPWLSERPLEEVILDAEFEDPTGARAELAWRVVDAAGGHRLAHTKVRLERDNAFEGVYTLMEEYDDAWLEANGFDGGLLYESEDYAYLTDVGPEGIGAMWDQKEPEDAPHDALADLAAAVDGPAGRERAAALLARIDVAALVDYYALQTVIGGFDTINHNIWLVQEPASGRWNLLPWDLDITFGLPEIIPLLPPLTPSVIDLAGAVAAEPRLTEMVMRRIRTLADTVLVPGGARAWYDQLVADLAPEMALDRAKWPNLRDPAEEQARVRDWLTWRRGQVDGHWAVPGAVPPPAGPPTVVVAELRATGAPAGDFVELANPGTTAVDVSGWTMAGATTATLPAGAVIPAGDRIVVPASAAPGDLGPASSGALVVGGLDGPLPDVGGSLVLRDAGGVERDRVDWQAGAPWPAAPGGRSIELRDPTADNTVPSNWSASAAVGGTPGAPRDAPGGLRVETWVDRPLATPGGGVVVDVEVVNAGPAARSAVEVTVPGVPACTRTYGRLAVGARRTHRCSVPVPAFVPGEAFTVVEAVATDGGGATARSRPRMVAAWVGVESMGLAVQPREVWLADGGRFDVRWDPLADTRPPLPPGAVVPSDPPVRAIHVDELEPGRAVPSGRGTTVTPPASSAVVQVTGPGPVRLAVSSRRVLTGPATVASPAMTPRPSPLWPAPGTGASARSAWATHALRVVLRRTPTTAEVNAWTSALAGGARPAALLDEALAGGRWAAQEAKVARLYAAFFDRPAETAGLAYWADRLARGASISVVAESFARSPEFRERFGAGSDGAFVDLVYRNVLGRSPDAEGRAYWVGRLRAGKTRGWVMAAFSESPEGRSHLAPVTDPVVIAYALTGDAPTGQAHAEAVAWLRAGGSRLTLVEAARSSPAFPTR